MSHLICYHANSESKLKKFEETGEMILHEDSYWLGKGMYFWDNFGNAIFWKNEKIRKSEHIIDGKIRILKAKIKLDKLLDLTDPEEIKKIDIIWRTMEKKTKKNIKSEELGKKIDIIIEFFPKDIYKYDIIKGIFQYNNDIAKRMEFSKETRLTANVKVIYNVKNKENILEKKIMNEEDENG